MIGIEFKIKNEYNNYLYKILHSIDVTQYDWEIISDSIICSDHNTDGLFKLPALDGQNFFNRISENNYYLIFADVKAFPANTIHKPISSFDDFIKSDCQIVLLCIDCEFVEFFCKDSKVLNRVIYNCKKFGFEDIRNLSAEDASNISMIAF